MVEDPNIEATKRAMDDLRTDINKMNRIHTQLSTFKGREEMDVKFAELYAERIQQSVIDGKQIKELLRKHLEAMGGR